MPRRTPKRISKIHSMIRRWYNAHRRELRWRETRDPYEILVSEVMLQQTQVSRVQEKLPKFLKSFPTIGRLARASGGEVIRAWEGMGYNNRALRLRETAVIAARQYGGRIPNDVDQLGALPGIGPYTAHALACFAFGKRVPVVDVNIHRVLSRLFHRMPDALSVRPVKEIWSLAASVLPKDAYIWNQALMDLGSAICVARKPVCHSCPIREVCASNHLELSRTKVSGARARAAEPMYAGLPRRLWRGKIVQTLRALPNRTSISIGQLGTAVKENFRTIDERWLTDVVGQLANDGLVTSKRRSGKTFVSLTER